MTMVSEILGRRGSGIAVIAGRREVSYAQLASDVHRATAYLAGAGLAGRTIGIHIGEPQTESDYPTWVAHLAAMRAGATHVSVINASMFDRLADLVKVDALVGRMPEGTKVSTASLVPFDLDSLPAAAESEDHEDQAVRLSLTSGTTGEPKLVRWTAAEIAERVAQAGEVGEVGPESRVGSLLGLRTTAGFRYPLATWRAGGCVLLANRLATGDGRTAISRSTLLVCSPFQLQNLMNRSQRWPGKDERTVAVLGGRVPAALRQWALVNLGARILVSYGSTETGNIAHGDAALSDRHPGAVGHVRSGIEVRIVGENGKPVPAGETGKVQLRPAASAESGRRGKAWLETGDLGILFDDGLLAIEGRDSDVLNVAGIKLDSGEVEAKLVAIDGVADAAVSVFDSGDREIIAVAVQPDEGRQLQEFVSEVSPLLPRGAEYRMFFLKQIPRNEMGKVDRPRLSQTVRTLLRPAAAPRARVNA